jgi:hypothetical protein
MPQHSGDFSRRTLIADFELSGRELIFSVLEIGGHDSTAHGAMQMFAALPRVAAGLGVTAGTHHGHA